MAEVDLNVTAAEDESPAQDDDLYDGWGDDSDIVAAEGEEEAAESAATEDEDDSESEDHTEEEAKPEEAESKAVASAEEKPAEAKKYTLKHLDSEQEMTAEEMIPLAQKGMDYDRIREERDGMKANYSKYEQYAKFLERIKGKFDSVEALMDDTDATLLVKNEADNGRTLTKDEALKRVKANREAEFKDTKTPKASEQETKTEDADSARKAEIQRFSKALTDDGLKVPLWNDLPDEVKKSFEKSGELTVPYYRWLAKQRDGELKTLKQNKTNKERSTGPRLTKGKSDSKNPIFDGWGDD